MKPLSLLPLGTLLASLLLVACDGRVSGGNGTSTDNVVTARMVSVDSIAWDLPGGDSGPYPLLVSLDSANIDFSNSFSDGSDLRVQRLDSTALPFQIREWSAATRHASLWVRLDSFHRGSAQRILLRTGKDSTINRSDPVATWAGVSDSDRLVVASVLLADFENGSSLVPLPCACNNWYASGSSGATLTLPAPGAAFSTAIQAAGDGRTGKALHLSFTAKSPEWVLAGTNLGIGYHRFGGLDSITFWARGKGTMHISLENRRDTSGHMKAWAGFAMDTAWTRYAIKPSQFDAPGSTFGWRPGVSDSVTTFSVFGQDGTDLWIDDIRFNGLSPSEIP
ncbi:MAG TPA: DUF2341 domain-containing protein [Fibrobacteria bacterium]|nr:DUF2341 domain-containing protein [Fibrobacteria bacterium]